MVCVVLMTIPWITISFWSIHHNLLASGYLLDLIEGNPPNTNEFLSLRAKMLSFDFFVRMNNLLDKSRVACDLWRNCNVPHLLSMNSLGILVHFLALASDHRTVSINNRCRYIYNAFSHWLNPLSCDLSEITYYTGSAFQWTPDFHSLY